MVGVVEAPHGQLLQGQDMILLCANGLHLGREEDGQLPGRKGQQLHLRHLDGDATAA